MLCGQAEKPFGAVGLGKDEPAPDEAMRVKLRGQALGWLKAELELSSTIVESGPPQARPGIVRTLKDWRKVADLASIRDPEALARLPEAERKEWEALWAGVETLIEKESQPSTGRQGPETKDDASR